VRKALTAGLLLTIAWTLVAIVEGPTLLQMWDLRRASAMTEGVVLSVDASNHNRATFRYYVNGVELIAYESASRYEPGDEVTVYYSPRDPKLSILRDPAKAFLDALYGTLVLCGLIGAAALVAALRNG